MTSVVREGTEVRAVVPECFPSREGDVGLHGLSCLVRERIVVVLRSRVFWSWMLVSCWLVVAPSLLDSVFFLFGVLLMCVCRLARLLLVCFGPCCFSSAFLALSLAPGAPWG